MTIQDDNDDFIDPRSSIFAPKGPTVPRGERQVQSYDNDKGRVASATVNQDGTITSNQSGYSRGSVADTHGRDARGTFTSMRGPGGFNPVTADRLTPDSIVGIEGYGEMKLSSAIAAGLAVKLHDGTYAPGAPQPVEEKQEKHPDLESEAFSDPAAEQALTGLCSGTSPSTQLTAVRELTTTGEISERTMGHLASELGVATLGDVEGRIAPVVEQFRKQANAVVEAHGVPAEDVWSWARENMPRELQESMHRHATMRQTGGYNEVAQAYVENLDAIAPDTVLNATFGPGVQVKREMGGKIIVHTRNGSFPWKSAIRAGLIKLGRK